MAGSVSLPDQSPLVDQQQQRNPGFSQPLTSIRVGCVASKALLKKFSLHSLAFVGNMAATCPHGETRSNPGRPPRAVTAVHVQRTPSLSRSQQH